MIRLDDDRVVLARYEESLHEAEVERMARELQRQAQRDMLERLKQFVTTFVTRRAHPKLPEASTTAQR